MKIEGSAQLVDPWRMTLPQSGSRDLIRTQSHWIASPLLPTSLTPRRAAKAKFPETRERGQSGGADSSLGKDLTTLMDCFQANSNLYHVLRKRFQRVHLCRISLIPCMGL